MALPELKTSVEEPKKASPTFDWFDRTLAPDFLLRRVEWFFLKKITPKPGFLFGSFGAPLRVFIIDEDSLGAIESAFEKKHLVKELYGAGKEMAYRCLASLGLPNKNFVLRGALAQNFIYFFKLAWNHDACPEINWSKNKIRNRQRGIVLLKKFKRAHFLLGCWTGSWAYFFQDEKVESTPFVFIRNSQDFDSITVTARPDRLSEKPLAVHPKCGLPRFDSRYLTFNSVLDSSREPLLALPEEQNVLTAFNFNGRTFFVLDSSAFFVLESFLTPKQRDSLVYAPAFASYRDFAKSLKNGRSLSQSLSFVCSFFETLGWGLFEFDAKKKTVQIRGFPWSPELEKIKFSQYFLGCFDGLLSGLTRRKIKSRVKNIDVSQNRYDVLLELSVK